MWGNAASAEGEKGIFGGVFGRNTMVAEDVEEHEVVAGGVLLEEGAHVGNGEGEAVVGLEAEEAGRGGDNGGGDFDAGETCVSEVVV